MARVTTSGVTKAPPAWAGDFGGREHIMPFPLKLDASLFFKSDSVLATVGAAGAAIGATSVPVAALSGAIPNGTLLDFTGSGKFALLTAEAAVGATTLTVEALPQALVSGDTARYAGASTILKSVPSGIPVGRTIAERDASALWGPAVDTDDEIYLIVFDIPNLDDSAEAEAYRPGSVVKENYLPKWGNTTIWPAALVTKLRTLYRFILGKE